MLTGAHIHTLYLNLEYEYLYARFVFKKGKFSLIFGNRKKPETNINDIYSLRYRPSESTYCVALTSVIINTSHLPKAEKTVTI